MSKLIKMATAELNAGIEKEQIEFKLDKLLRQKGWESTSSTPGCLWLWRKKLTNGEIYLVNKSTAIHMQSWLDEYGEA